MVLRLFKKDGCVKTLKPVDRLISNPLGNIEVRVETFGADIWRSFQREVDFDSFILSTE